MLKEKMLHALNDQIREEIKSAYIYLAMAADLESKNWEGSASWMKKQYNEEISHATKIYGYIYERGGKVTIQAIDAPPPSYSSILEAFQAAYKHEQYISGCIDKLVKMARELDDISTEVFLQWFVSEQVEEEANTRGIVDKLKLIGDSTNGIFMLDHGLGKRE